MRRRLFPGLHALAYLAALVLLAPPARSGEFDAVETKTFDAALGAGWDSLYMYRGVNSLRSDGGYGSGISWTELDLTWNISASDSFALNTWHGFGLRETYGEFDASLVYTRVLPYELNLGFEYDFYYGHTPALFISHELALTLARDFRLGPVTLTPSLVYNFNLGPDVATGVGSAKAASSFLLFQLDADLPLYRDIVSLMPWIAFGLNFDYNTRTLPTGEDQPFLGANNLECGLALPIKVNDTISLSGYIAYSHAFADLSSTRPDTFWTGAGVTFSY